jgi:hypothetical protein
MVVFPAASSPTIRMPVQSKGETGQYYDSDKTTTRASHATGPKGRRGGGAARRDPTLPPTGARPGSS